jgi:predicted house-cleaning noncanonical NTP pyrophosphatase (MazG superfamily)
MKFHRFKVAKLIRDKIPALMAQEKVLYHLQYLQGQEYIDHLKLKLLEEAKEVQEAKDQTNLTEEMADVLEVIHALAKANHISLEDIESKRLEKTTVRGGFDQGSYCAYMDIPADHSELKKYQAMPHKYPELVPSKDGNHKE